MSGSLADMEDDLLSHLGLASDNLEPSQELKLDYFQQPFFYALRYIITPFVCEARIKVLIAFTKLIFPL